MKTTLATAARLRASVISGPSPSLAAMPRPIRPKPPRYKSKAFAPRSAASDSKKPTSYLDLLDFDTFEWNGYNINYAVNKTRKPGSLSVLLVHGFGASIGHFKKNIVELISSGYDVHAIDLLGFGASEKPYEYQYTMEGWRDLLVSYLKEKVIPSSTSEGVVIVGNSIGSLASLLTAKELVDESLDEKLKGVVLLNCAGGMNNAAVLDDDWRIKLAYPTFALINALLKIKPVAQFLFDKFRNKETIENVLREVYRNQDSVDDDLVELIRQPSCAPGALEAFVSILTGPPGPRPESAVGSLEGAEVPMLVLWGDDDPFTPIDGPVGKFFMESLEPRCDFVTKSILPDTGHCPHDDRPEEVHKVLLPWLAQLQL